MALGPIFRRFLSGTGGPPYVDNTLPGDLPQRQSGVGQSAAPPTGIMGGGTPGLEGGATHRRLTAWRPSAEHINTLLRAAGPTTIARARWLARNNGYARAAVRSWRDATVGGAGIKPSSLIPTLLTREAVHLAWHFWSREADAEGVTNLSGLQRRVSGEVFLAGECFVRLRYRRPEDGLTVPLQLQVIPSEQLPIDKEDETPNGNPVRMGIEFNRNLRDRREAYWFYRSNPSDKALSFRDAFAADGLTRVPANEILHIYDPGEAGQIRGLTGFGAAMVKMFHLDLYDDAELERKKQAARHAAVITSAPDDTSLVATESDDLPPVLPYGPGAYLQLNPGEDIKFTEPAEVGGSYEPFQYRTLLAIAAGLGIPYGELSHDLTKANYSSSRAGLVAFRTGVEAFQHAVLIHQMLSRVWDAWFDAAVLAGAIPITAAELRATPHLLRHAKFITPKLPWVDPAKDARGEEIMVNNGYKARSDVIESLGADPEETDLRIAADKERAERLGLTFPLAARSAQVVATPDELATAQEDAGTERSPEADSDAEDNPDRREEGADNAA